MKKFLLFFCLVLLQNATFAQPVVPGSSFPVVETPGDDYRFLMVNTNGNTPGSTSIYTRSNATMRYDSLKSAITTISGSALVYHQFNTNTTLWPTNWLSDSGYGMFRMPNETGLLTPLYVTNYGTTNLGLGLLQGVNYDTSTYGNGLVYVSVSNSPAFDVLGLNFMTATIASGTNGQDSWGINFLISPFSLVGNDAKLNINLPNYIHVGISGNPDGSGGVGVILATNLSISGVGYSGNLPISVYASYGGNSIHNVEVRRMNSTTMAIAVDQRVVFQFSDVTLPQFWGTNCIWEYASKNVNDRNSAYDRSRTYLRSIYSAKLNHTQDEFSRTPMSPSQFTFGDGSYYIKDGVGIGSFIITNHLYLGTSQNIDLSWDSFWNMLSVSPGLITPSLRVTGSGVIGNNLTVGSSTGGINLGVFGTSIQSPGTNYLSISGVNLVLGFPTNNTPAFSAPNGTIVTLTNGNMYVKKDAGFSLVTVVP